MRSNRGEAVVVAPLPAWRCHSCRALLLRGTLGPHTHLEIVCRRCGSLNVVTTMNRT
jgi:phage FluMu protein Com